MTTSLLARLGRGTVDLLFPPRCAVCGRGGPFLCDECASSLPRALPPRCSRCWRPIAAGEPCLDCESRASPLDSVRSAFLYLGPVRDLVHALKYDGQTALAGPMIRLMEAEVHRQGSGVALVVPVPLFGRRRRSRGYNQSALLAREIGKLLAVPVAEGALLRMRNTPPQVRIASAGERRSNVQGAFACRDARVAGRSVLLVDDVTTTGATLEACATTLNAAGASSVRALTFARED
jgi:competence protein ComFC